jgi:aryl carrier-like protein
LSDFEKTALDVDSLADQLSPLAVKPVTGGGVPPKVSEEASESSARADTTIITDIRRTASEFLGVSGDVLTDSTSFVSLGLDSIKAVGLAKRINKLGYNVNSVEVLKASTIQKLAEVISAKSSRDEEKSQAQVESMFEATLASLRKKIDINSLKLSPGDNPGVYPATALQAGMLSQVSPNFHAV